MTHSASKRFEEALYVLAKDFGSPCNLNDFERALGITVEGHKKATPENQRQTFKRFREWALALGLELSKVIERDEPVLITYDVERALSLVEVHKARRLHRKLPSQVSQAEGIQRPMNDTQNPADHMRGNVMGGPDPILDSKGLAKVLLISVKKAREIMRGGELRTYLSCGDSGPKRTRLSWVYEWTERRAK